MLSLEEILVILYTRSQTKLAAVYRIQVQVWVQVKQISS